MRRLRCGGRRRKGVLLSRWAPRWGELETLAQRGPIVASQGSTSLLILPGHEFRVVTDLVTNFHLPKSSLLMLVSAFAGREQVLAAYREAMRWAIVYSYGDAMFIRPGPCPPQPTNDEP